MYNLYLGFQSDPGRKLADIKSIWSRVTCL